jgi:N-acetyl-1-D-myo-inositol-2-amino-2-deoxy-alpha-D-glucopyranoside deacetylase
MGSTQVKQFEYLNVDTQAMALFREQELSQALEAFPGVEHRYLGKRAYKDSGMRINAWGKVGKPRKLDEMALAAAGTSVVGEDIADEIRDFKPDAVVTYDAKGGYGHPDHKASHAAVAWAIRQVAKERIKPEFWEIAEPGNSFDIEFGDEETAELKKAALEAHGSQVEISGDEIIYNGKTRMRLSDKERLRKTSPSPLLQLKPALTYFWAIPTGVLVGIAGTLLHRSEDGSGFPIGLVVALSMVASLALALRMLRNSRGALYLMSFSLIITVFLMAQRQPGGELFITTDLQGNFFESVGNLWAYGSILVVGLIMVFPQLRGSAWKEQVSRNG